MINVKIDGVDFPEAKIRAWEQDKTGKMLRFLKKKIPCDREITNAEEFAAWKASVPEEEIRRAIRGLNGFCAWVTGLAVGVSHGRRKISVAEIDVDYCNAQTLYTMFLETMLNNTPENIRCNLRANPEHFVLKGVDANTQEVIEISGGIPFPERFFIRYGDESGLVSVREPEYPFQAAGAAFLEGDKIIGGVRHQMKDTPQGCHIKLMVEFPAVMPDANIWAHQYHLACEFYNWFSEFGRRLANG